MKILTGELKSADLLVSENTEKTKIALFKVSSTEVLNKLLQYRKTN